MISTDIKSEWITKLRSLGYNVLVSSAEVEEKITGIYDCFIFDIDGVLLQGRTPIPGVIESMKELRHLKKKIYFVTNTAAKSRKSCAQIFVDVGIEAYEEEVITTSYAAAIYIKEHYPLVRKAFIIGEPEMATEFIQAGIEVLMVKSDDNEVIKNENDFANYAENKIDPEVDVVVVGWDRSFDSNKLYIACIYLQNKTNKCINNGSLIPFISTNLDPFTRIGNMCMPANGAVVSSIETATGRKSMCIGKPSDWLAEWLLNRINIDKARCVFVGDRFDTDIYLANKMGIDSVVVLTGCTTAEYVVSNDPIVFDKRPVRPSFVLSSFAKVSNRKF